MSHLNPSPGPTSGTPPVDLAGIRERDSAYDQAVLDRWRAAGGGFGMTAILDRRDLLTEVGRLSGQVQRIELLEQNWRRAAETAISADTREWFDAFCKTLRAALDGAV